MWTTRLQQWWSGLQEDIPESLAPPDSYKDADVAAMLRELGIALVEVVQPTQLVRTRLLSVARRYTTKPVRVVVLPTVLLLQLGSATYEVDGTTRATTQLDLAGRVDHIARLAAAGAVTPTDGIRAVEEARAMPPRFNPFVTVLGLRHHHGRLQHDHQPHLGIAVGARVPRPDRRPHGRGGPAVPCADRHRADGGRGNRDHARHLVRRRRRQ